MDDFVHLCPVCKEKGVSKFLQLRQINLVEAVYLCSDLKCTYPNGHSWIFKDRRLSEDDESSDSDLSDIVNEDIERAKRKFSKEAKTNISLVVSDTQHTNNNSHLNQIKVLTRPVSNNKPDFDHISPKNENCGQTINSSNLEATKTYSNDQLTKNKQNMCVSRSIFDPDTALEAINSEEKLCNEQLCQSDVNCEQITASSVILTENCNIQLLNNQDARHFEIKIVPNCDTSTLKVGDNMKNMNHFNLELDANCEPTLKLSDTNKEKEVKNVVMDDADSLLASLDLPVKENKPIESKFIATESQNQSVAEPIKTGILDEKKKLDLKTVFGGRLRFKPKDIKIKPGANFSKKVIEEAERLLESCTTQPKKKLTVVEEFCNEKPVITHTKRAGKFEGFRFTSRDPDHVPKKQKRTTIKKEVIEYLTSLKKPAPSKKLTTKTNPKNPKKPVIETNNIRRNMTISTNNSSDEIANRVNLDSNEKFNLETENKTADINIDDIINAGFLYGTKINRISQEKNSLELDDCVIDDLFHNIDNIDNTSVPSSSATIAEVDDWLSTLCQ